MKITPAALADVQAAMDYYNARSAGLGDQFEAVIAAYLENISRQPESGTFHKGNIRYRVVRRFPYVIFYQFNDEAIYVLRIFNTHMDPQKM